MRSKQFGFWTEDRLVELESLYHIKTPTELKKHFGKSHIDIIRAYDYRMQSKHMTQDILIENGIRVTRYKAAFAEGVTTQGSIAARRRNGDETGLSFSAIIKGNHERERL